MKNNKKNIADTMEENFIKGLTGKEEETSKARLLTSSEPLPNEMLPIKRLYTVCLISIILGIIITPLAGIGILGLIIVYLIDISLVDHKLQRLRRAKFKFVADVNDNKLFEVMQSIFISKYGMLVEKTEDGKMTLSHDGYIYDILLQPDNTFVIWWRTGVKKALLPSNTYKSYRKILAAMGIIAYEIQKAFKINYDIIRS